MIFLMLFCLLFLLDVEKDVVVELCKFHSLDVMSCCAQCCCRLNFFIEIVVVDDVGFASVLLDVEGTLDVERLVVHSLVVRSCCAEPLSPHLCCEPLLNQLVVLIIVAAVVLH